MLEADAGWSFDVVVGGGGDGADVNLVAGMDRRQGGHGNGHGAGIVMNPEQLTRTIDVGNGGDEVNGGVNREGFKVLNGVEFGGGGALAERGGDNPQRQYGNQDRGESCRRDGAAAHERMIDGG